MATVLVLAFVAIPLVLTVALTPLALALFPVFDPARLSAARIS